MRTAAYLCGELRGGADLGLVDQEGLEGKDVEHFSAHKRGRSEECDCRPSGLKTQHTANISRQQTAGTAPVPSPYAAPTNPALFSRNGLPKEHRTFTVTVHAHHTSRAAAADMRDGSEEAEGDILEMLASEIYSRSCIRVLPVRRKP